MRTRIPLVLAAAAALALVPCAASAHHPGIEGYQDCDGSVVYKAVAWTPEDGNPAARTNRKVEIRIWPDDPATAADDLSEAQIAALTPLHTGAFVPANKFEFGGVWAGRGAQAPYSIRATAVVPWDDGDQAGRTAQGRIAVKADCPAPSTSTTTTVAPATTQAPTTTAPAPAAGPEPPAPALPFTGASTTVPFLAGGLALVAAGLAALRLGRRGDNRQP